MNRIVMDKRTLVYLVKQFRQGIVDSGQFDGFPRGYCKITSLLLARFLIESGIVFPENINLVWTSEKDPRDSIAFDDQTHAWISIGDLNIDITASQFPEIRRDILFWKEWIWRDKLSQNVIIEPYSPELIAKADEKYKVILKHTGVVEPLPGNRLYHYTTLETAIKYILPNMTLRLGPIVRTNDPRENKSFRFRHVSKWGSRPLTAEQMHILDGEYCNKIREDVKVLCFCDDYKHSFGHNLSNMWAHYGGRHTGICLVINKAVFVQENKHLYNIDLLRRVKYATFNPQRQALKTLSIDHTRIEKMGLEQYLHDFRLKHLGYLYFTKKIEWQSESEIRLLHFSKTPGADEFCCIKTSLREIHLGIDFDNSSLNKLKQLLKNMNIPIHKKEHENIGLISRNISD